MTLSVQIHTIHFIISTVYMSNSSIWPIDRTLLGHTYSAKNGPRGDDNKGILHTPQSSRITGASLSDCLVSYSGYSLLEGILPLLQRCSRRILWTQQTEPNYLFVESYCFKYSYQKQIIYTRSSYLPTPSLGQDMTQGQFLSLTGLNSELSFS